MTVEKKGDNKINSINESASSISEEITLLRKKFPRVKIASSTNHFINASYERTKYTRVRLTLTFPEEYPNTNLIVDVGTDEAVPPGLKKKLEKELGKAVTDHLGKYEQVGAVFEKLVNFVEGNKFLPCWRQLKQSIDLIQSKKDDKGPLYGSKISIVESKGKINLRLQHDKYFYTCSIFVDDNYPSTSRIEDFGKSCRLKMESTNFPTKIEHMLTSQAQDLVRRMQEGMSSEDALKMSNPIRGPKNFKSDAKKEVKARLTQTALKDLKRDTETLKRVHDLREVDSAAVEWNAHVKAHDAKERKDARRMINKLTQSEISEDLAKEAKEKKWQMEEQARMAGYNFTEYDGSNPQPSLLSLVTFLIQKIQLLPEEQCPVCKKNTLPKNPQDLKSLYLSVNEAKTDKEKKARRAAKLKRPTRTYCGCWYHYDCLNKFMTEPPFGAACLGRDCGRRVFHPDWPSEIKQLERAWAMKQARLREIEDAAMFL